MVDGLVEVVLHYKPTVLGSDKKNTKLQPNEVRNGNVRLNAAVNEKNKIILFFARIKI